MVKTFIVVILVGAFSNNVFAGIGPATEHSCNAMADMYLKHYGKPICPPGFELAPDMYHCECYYVGPEKVNPNSIPKEDDEKNYWIQ